MPGFRMLSPFAPILVLIFFIIFSKIEFEYSFLKFQKVLLFTLLTIATYFGVFSTSNKQRFYFDRSYYYKGAEISAAYWNSILSKDEVYITAVAGALPYYANKMIVKDFHGLVNPCVGRDEKLKGNTFGKRKWACMFDEKFIVQYVNTVGFAKEFNRHSRKNGVEFYVVVKNNTLIFSNEGSITFARKKNIEALQKKDPSLEFISFDKYRKIHKF